MRVYRYNINIYYYEINIFIRRFAETYSRIMELGNFKFITNISRLQNKFKQEPIRCAIFDLYAAVVKKKNVFVFFFQIIYHRTNQIS